MCQHRSLEDRLTRGKAEAETETETETEGAVGADAAVNLADGRNNHTSSIRGGGGSSGSIRTGDIVCYCDGAGTVLDPQAKVLKGIDW